MATPGIKVTGVKETLQALENFEGNIDSCVRTACWRLGGKIMMQAKNNARSVFTGTPSEAPEPGTPTGRLMGSITMKSNFGQQTAGLKSPAKPGDEIGKPGGAEPLVAVGTNISYSPYVEHGTRKMHARSFLYPAFFAFENDFEAVLRDTIEKKMACQNFNRRLPIFDPEGAWE